MDIADVRLVVKEPGKAYVSNMLWLPKDRVRSATVQEALQFWEVKKGEAVLNKLWDENDTHIIVPREFITPDQYINYNFPFIDLNPRRFNRTHVGDAIEWKDDDQVKAWNALKVARGGILNLACGKGKTVLALKKISALQVPTLIVVNDGVQFDHWKKEIAEHLSLPPGESVGEYQAGNLDWKHPITIAMIQTLAGHVRDEKLPIGFGAWFGASVFDEIHHLAAPFFVLTAPVVNGQRFGLTATANRLDQLQWIYNYHVGNVFYSDLSQDLIPSVFFQETDVVVNYDKDDVKDKSGQVHISKLWSFLGSDDRSLKVREFCIREALDAGRKILCISHSKNMLIELQSRFQGSALCVAETPQGERISSVQQSRVAFAIRKLGAECLNDKALDALFILTELSSPNDLQQMLGRIQRDHPSKMPPVAVIFDDKHIEKLHKLLYSAKKYLRDNQIPYKTLSVPTI